MQSRRSRRVLLAIVMTLSPRLLLAQDTGAIAGDVKDTTGAVLPGVTVEASSPALIERVRSVVTDNAGQYKIVDLRPGTYTVTFTLTGFGTVKREAINLTAGFTAGVNVEMRVGSLEETVVVSSQSPVVDVQNVREQRVLTREVLDTVPTSKTMVQLAALLPGMNVIQTSTGAAQDVGGTSGDNFQGLTIHGGRRNDQQTLIDGMSVAFLSFFGGSITATSLGDGTIDQTVIEVSGHAAEIESGGVVASMVLKQGGNQFHGNLFTNYTTQGLQANNYTDELKAQGLVAPQPIKSLSDFNPNIGGPIMADKLWFFTAYRDKRSTIYTDPNTKGFNLNPSGWTFVPDLVNIPVQDQFTKDTATRLTWQASPKNRLAVMYEWNRKTENHAGGGPLGTDQTTYVQVYTPNIIQGTWSAPVTSRLLFEAGFSLTNTHHTQTAKADAVPVGATELTTGKSFRYPLFGSGIAPQVNVDEQGNNHVYRAAVSYVTGSHAFKVGFVQQDGSLSNLVSAAAAYQVSLFNGVPSSVTFLATPYTYQDYFYKTSAFGQDQWRFNRMTVNAGLRFDMLRTRYPDQLIAATEILPARSFPGADVLSWKDLSPRLGWSWDVTGDGKTAIKASASRYVLQEALDLTRAVDPTTSSGSPLTRTWVDTNTDFVPQGDPLNPAANGELGPSPNANFGKAVATITYDPKFASGFAVRPYEWEFTVGAQRELMPRVSVNAAYFRRIYGNFMVTDNLPVAASDYDPFCITAPTDPRLPGGGGQKICGLLDLNPSKLGKLQQLGTAASNYGTQIEHWNGIDLSVNARAAGAFIQGGFSTGRTVTDNCAVFAQVPEGGTSGITGATAALGGPYCHQQSPFLTQFKLVGSYMFPWDVQVSANFQSIPGQQELATYVATNAQIAPSLGRNLSAGATATASINLIAPNSMFGPRVNQIDMRFARTFRLRTTSIKGMVDLYNLTNNNVVLLWNNTYGTNGANWLVPAQILGARMLKFGVQIDF